MVGSWSGGSAGMGSASTGSGGSVIEIPGSAGRAGSAGMAGSWSGGSAGIGSTNRGSGGSVIEMPGSSGSAGKAGMAGSASGGNAGMGRTSGGIVKKHIHGVGEALSRVVSLGAAVGATIVGVSGLPPAVAVDIAVMAAVTCAIHVIRSGASMTG